MSDRLESNLLEFLGSEWLGKLELSIVDEALRFGENVAGEGVEIIKEVGPDSLGIVVGALRDGDESWSG